MKNFWQFVELGKIFKAVSERHHPDLEVLTIIQGRGTVPRKNFGIKISFKEESRGNYKRVERGDFIIHLRSFQGGFEMANSEGIVSPAYTVLRNVVPIANGFFKAYFRTHDFIFRDIAKFVEGIRDGKKINYSQITEIKLPFPPLAEQEKIAELFANIDNAIDEQENKLLNWRGVKKGLLQKIFSQEFRFTDDDGNFYPDWQEKTLGDLGNFYGGLHGKTKENFGHGDAEFITYMNVYKNDFADLNQLERVEISAKEKQNLVQYGDVLFTLSSELVEEAATPSVWLHDKKVYLNSFCMGFRLHDFKTLLPQFAVFLMKSPEARKKIILESQGITRFNVTMRGMKNLKLKIPCVEEQKKIADYFTELDKIISAESRILENMKLMKKGFCQKIFSQEWEFEI